MVSLSPDVQVISDHEGATLFDVERGVMTTLNATGAWVCRALERQESIDAIVVRLARESEQDLPTVDREVRSFMQELSDRGLVREDGRL